MTKIAMIYLVTSNEQAITVLAKYEEEGTWTDSRVCDVQLDCSIKGYVETVRTYNAAGELIKTEEVTFNGNGKIVDRKVL